MEKIVLSPRVSVPACLDVDLPHRIGVTIRKIEILANRTESTTRIQRNGGAGCRGLVSLSEYFSLLKALPNAI
jgi:hypothetical protein